MQITTYKEAVNYLESFIGKIRFEVTPEFLRHHDPLERMKVLLDLLGNPQKKFPSVLVGGTSGKGSTAYLISHILKTADYKTGLTTSPHLQKINERIQIGGEQITDQKFTSLLSLILYSIEGMRGMPVGAPSYFEILIAMAFLHFSQQKVDIAVVEVGMGGEFDATNTLYPLIAVLTNVSLDHTSILGGTVQKIAKTKVGIIKSFSSCHPEFISGSPARRQVSLQLNEMLKQVQHDKRKPVVVTGVKQSSVIKIVEEKCREVGAEVFRLHKDFKFKIKTESLDGSVFDFYSQRVLDSTSFRSNNNKFSSLLLSLLGKHQIENASLAMATVLQLKKFGFKVFEEHIRKALKTAFFPGRFEVINYTLVLDGAHNPTKIRAFLSTLKKLYPKNPKIFVVAFKSDKDIKGMLRQILEVADTVIVTEFRVKTDMSASASAEALNIKNQILKIKYGGDVVVEKDSKKALDKALSLSTIQQPARNASQSDDAGGFNNSTIIVVTGSLYLVGEIRNMLYYKSSDSVILSKSKDLDSSLRSE